MQRINVILKWFQVLQNRDGPTDVGWIATESWEELVHLTEEAFMQLWSSIPLHPVMVAILLITILLVEGTLLSFLQWIYSRYVKENPG